MSPETTAGATTGIATGDDRNSSSNQPQSFGDFGHGYYSRPENQVNLLALLLLEEQGNLASTPTGDEELPYDMQQTSSLRSLAKLEKHKLCLSTSPTTTTSQPKGTTSLQSLFVQTTMEPLPHGQFDLVPASH